MKLTVTITFESLEDLQEFYEEHKKQFAKPANVIPINDDMEGREFEEVMTDKGYLCRSIVAKNKISRELEIRRLKHGSKWKYNRKDVLNAPLKIVNRPKRRKIRHRFGNDSVAHFSAQSA